MSLQPNCRYLVLTGDPDNIRYYQQICEGSNTQITHEESIFYLTSSDIQQLQSNAEVYQRGQQILDTLHGTVSLLRGMPYDISISSLINTPTPGVRCGTGSSCIGASVCVTNVILPEKIEQLKSLYNIASRKGEIAECLKWLRAGFPSSYDIYKIIEIIEEDCKKITGKEGKMAFVKSGLTDFDTIDKLYLNANHQGLHGDNARHARIPGTPLAEKYMELHDMQHLIVDIILKWINLKQ